MGTQSQENTKPVFAILGFNCLILPVPIARLAVHFLAPAEDFIGYGGLDIGLAAMLGTLAVGMIISLVSLLKRERFRLFSILCILTQSAIVIWILFNLP